MDSMSEVLSTSWPVRGLETAGVVGRALDVDLDDLGLDDLALLADAHADAAAEGLGQRLGLGHLHREDLAAGDHGEGRLGAERVGHAHRDGRLARARGACEQNAAASDLALLDHLDDNTGGAASLALANHTLALLSRGESVIETKAANVGVRTDALNSS